MGKRFLAACALLSLAGCEAALQSVSAGRVGCSPDDVVIANDSVGFNTRSWDATCHGHVYHCSASGGGKSSSDSISCAEDAAEAEARTPGSSPQLVVAPIVPAASLTPNPVPGRKRRWRDVSPVDCGVTLLFPGAPTEERHEQKTAVGPIVVYAAHADAPDGAAALSCFKIPGTSAVNVKKAFDGGRADMLKSMQATLDSEREIVLDGDSPARDVTFSFKGEKGRVRLVYVDRTIVILTLAPLRAFSDSEVKAFFASVTPTSEDDER